MFKLIPLWVYALVAVFAYSGAFYAGWSVESWRMGAQLSTLQKNYAERLALANANVVAAEHRGTLITEQLEMTNDAATKTVEAQATENRRLVRELGGLRDPGTHFTTPGVSVTYPPPGGAPAGPTTCKLSDELEEFLQAEAARADAAAVYAQTGHGYAVEMTK